VEGEEIEEQILKGSKNIRINQRRKGGDRKEPAEFDIP